MHQEVCLLALPEITRALNERGKDSTPVYTSSRPRWADLARTGVAQQCPRSPWRQRRTRLVSSPNLTEDHAQWTDWSERKLERVEAPVEGLAAGMLKLRLNPVKSTFTLFVKEEIGTLVSSFFSCVRSMLSRRPALTHK